VDVLGGEGGVGGLGSFWREGKVRRGVCGCRVLRDGWGRWLLLLLGQEHGEWKVG
jgi:hypothetical protein